MLFIWWQNTAQQDITKNKGVKNNSLKTLIIFLTHRPEQMEITRIIMAKISMVSETSWSEKEKTDFILNFLWNTNSFLSFQNNIYHLNKDMPYDI